MEVSPSVPVTSDEADVVMVGAVDPTKTWSSFIAGEFHHGI
jgi:hypothetical protein